MRWEILEKSWKLAKINFPDIESIFVALPAKFKAEGQIPVYDLSSYKKIGEVSYKAAMVSGKSFVFVQCGPISDQVAISAASVSSELKIKTAESSSVENMPIFNLRQIKADSKNPITVSPVHIMLDGALVVADVIETRKQGKKGKEITWYRVKPAGKQETVWVPEDMVKPILAGQPLSGPFNLAASSKAKTITAAELDNHGFNLNTYRPLEKIQDVSSLPIGSIVLREVYEGLSRREPLLTGPYIKQRDTLDGLSARGSSNFRFGELTISVRNANQEITQNAASYFLGPMRVVAWDFLREGETYFLRNRNLFEFIEYEKKADSAIPSTQVYRQADSGELKKRLSKFTEPITHLEKTKANISELKRKLTPNTKIIFSDDTLGTFEGWQEYQSPINPSVILGHIMKIKLENGPVIEVDPFKKDLPRKAWILKPFELNDFKDYVDLGAVLAVCTDPVLANVKDLKKTIAGDGWIVALVGVKGNTATIRAKPGEGFYHVPLNTLRFLHPNEPIPPDLKSIFKAGHSYSNGDVVLRDKKWYIIDQLPGDEKKNKDTIRAKTKDAQGNIVHLELPLDSKNEFVGWMNSMGTIFKNPLGASPDVQKAKAPPPAPKKPPPPEI